MSSSGLELDRSARRDQRSYAIRPDNKIFQFPLGRMRRRTKIHGEPTRLEIVDRNVFRESVTVNHGSRTTHDQV